MLWRVGSALMMVKGTPAWTAMTWGSYRQPICLISTFGGWGGAMVVSKGASLGSTIQTTTSASSPLGPIFQFSVWRMGLSPQFGAWAMKVSFLLFGVPLIVTMPVTSAKE